MRLNSHDTLAIVLTLNTYIGNNQASLALYGSRTDDSKKGGDIDLLLTVHSDVIYSTLKSKKLKILQEIADKIGERKVDLLITTESKAKHDPFIKMIRPTSILLKRYGDSS